MAKSNFEVVENQLADNNPPEVKIALNRLLARGETRENAVRHIASALAIEIFLVASKGGSHNASRYAANLNALPAQPKE
jgi:hypothetical protein